MKYNGYMPPSQKGAIRSEETKQKIRDAWAKKRLMKLQLNN